MTAVPASPVPPLTDSNESDLDRMRSKGPEPGDTNGMFNACPECGMLWSAAAISLKDAARDEPTGEHARIRLLKTIAWTVNILATLGGIWFIRTQSIPGMAVCAALIIAGIWTIGFANRQERGSKRASGIAAD